MRKVLVVLTLTLTACIHATPSLSPETRRGFGCAADIPSQGDAPPRVGEPLCDVLVRLGDPDRVNVTRTSKAEFASLAWQTSGGYIRASAAKHYPSPALAIMGITPNLWTISTVAAF